MGAETPSEQFCEAPCNDWTFFFFLPFSPKWGRTTLALWSVISLCLKLLRNLTLKGSSQRCVFGNRVAKHLGIMWHDLPDLWDAMFSGLTFPYCACFHITASCTYSSAPFSCFSFLGKADTKPFCDFISTCIKTLWTGSCSKQLILIGSNVMKRLLLRVINGELWLVLWKAKLVHGGLYVCRHDGNKTEYGLKNLREFLHHVPKQ